MTTIKLSWGTRIALLYGGFVVLMVTLVTLSMKQDFQLVGKDYYQQELKYQEVIDAGKNQSLLSAPVSIQANGTTIFLKFPQEFDKKAVSGSISFYAPANAAWDHTVPITTESNIVAIAAGKLHPTNYHVKITWEAEGKTYYQESRLNLYEH